MSESHRPKAPSRRIIAITGAKGGVGASMVAANVGIFLAQIGKRVLLVDADSGSSGLCAWLGIARPEKNISDVFFGRVDRVQSAVVETRVTGLYLLSGAVDLLGSEVCTPDRVEHLWQQLCDVDVDYVIIDLRTGIENYALTLFTRADYPVIVSLATPDSVESSYRFMSAAWTHLFLQSPHKESPSVQSILASARMQPGQFRMPRMIVDLLRSADVDPAAIRAAEHLSATFHPQIIVNQIRIKEDEYLADAMKSAATRWLGIIPTILGSMGWDDNVWLALRRGKQLLIDFTSTRACRDLEQIVRRMLQLQQKDLTAAIQVPQWLEQQNYYEILEVYSGASEEEVRRAFKQIRMWFGPESIAVRGACTEAERQKFQLMAEEAHALLVDRSRRREYDRRHFPEGFTPSVDRHLPPKESIAGTVVATRVSLPRVALRDDQFIDGAFLGRIRREHNVELGDISNRAKISVAYLMAIEEERFEDLPAAVFTRGFVHEFARFLKVDPRRATHDFMAKFDSFFETRKRK